MSAAEKPATRLLPSSATISSETCSAPGTERPAGRGSEIGKRPGGSAARTTSTGGAGSHHSASRSAASERRDSAIEEAPIPIALSSPALVFGLVGWTPPQLSRHDDSMPQAAASRSRGVVELEATGRNQSSGFKITAASGGRVNGADWAKPCIGTGSASISPPLPRLPPPYSAESVLRASR